MTLDAGTSQPRKRSWKRLIVVLACVVVVTTIALLASAPKKEPVKVWFVCSTNYGHHEKLVFEGTNGLPEGIGFSAGVVTGTMPRAKTPTDSLTYYHWTHTISAAGTNFDFALVAPLKDVPYYVVWEFHGIGNPETRWEKFRIWFRDAFVGLGLGRPAKHSERPTHVHYIPSSEIKE
jgi:hypothetical protein